MRIVLFGEDFKLGVLNGDNVVDASQIANEIPHNTPQQMISKVIENFDQYKSRLEQLASSGQGTPVSQARLRAPLPRPGRLVCMAVNYMENGTRAEPAPIGAFNKSSSSVIGDGDTIVLPDSGASVYEHEAELALVIGKRAERIKAEDAYDYIFGYTNIVDVSHRGNPSNPGQRSNFFNGKSYHTFGPLGPAIVTADEVADPLNLQVHLSVQGELRQDYNTSDMAHKIPRALEWISWIMTLEPGDVVATGTNHQGLGPLQDGDKVEMEIANFGKLTNNVRDVLKRTWPRETRSQAAARAAR